MVAKIKNWFNNYWYYYKWPVIVLSVFAAIITVCVVQCAKKEEHDVTVQYTGPHIFSIGEKEALADAFEQLMDDYNGDGKKLADIMDLTAFTDEQIRDALGEAPPEESLIKYAPYTVKNVEKSFNNSIQGEGYILLVDGYWYDILVKNGALVSLSEVFGEKPKNAIDDHSVALGDLDFYKYFSDSVGKLPSDTYVCFKVLPITAHKGASKTYSDSLKLFKALIEFEMP